MEMNLSFDIEKFNHLIEQKLEHWLVETIKLIPNIIVAILTLFAFIFIANLGGRLFRNLSDRVVDSKEATNLLASIVKVGIITVGFCSIRFRWLARYGHITPRWCRDFGARYWFCFPGYD